MYLVVLGNKIHDDTYEFTFNDFEEATNFIEIAINNGHEITIKIAKGEINVE